MTEIRLTAEQAAAVDVAASGETFVLDAPAGSGKSSTAVEMAKAIKHGRVLYLVYNRAAKDDAMGKFPGNTTIKTTAALGWAAFGKDPGYERRMNFREAPRVPASMTAKLAGVTKPLDLGSGMMPIPPHLLARWAMNAIEKFCYSNDKVITDKHVPMYEIPAGLNPAQAEYLRQEIRKLAWKIWLQAIQPGSQHKFTLDYAYKMFISTSPQLGYDTVIVDEAQDSNMATHKMVSSQMAQQIVIGDPAQQLYAWRGAVDIMGKFEGERLQLTQSFRFGEAIAEEAEKWLAHTGTGIHIKGLSGVDSKVMDGGMALPNAVLCRTNAKAMAAAIEWMEMGQKVAIVGGTQSLKDLAFAAIDLRQGKPSTHPELIAFKNWAELMAFTEEPGGGDLKALVQLIMQYGSSELIRACNSLVDERRGYPDIVVSTAHKAKGREWGDVMVADDFKEPADVEDPFTGEATPGPINTSDAMLHYVTVTRARKALDRGSLEWIDRHEPIDKLGKEI